MSKASLSSAFSAYADAADRVPQSKLRALFSAAGWRSIYSSSKGTVSLPGATENDVVCLLRTLGHSDRSIGNGKLSLTLADIQPFFLAQCAGKPALPNSLLARSVIGSGLHGFHDLPPVNFALGRPSGSETAPPVTQLMAHSFMPKDLPPRPATALATRLRSLTHGAPSDPHTSAASLFTIASQPSSGDTGVLDTSRMSVRPGALAQAKDTRGSALLRISRATAGGAAAAAGGGLMTQRQVQLVVAAAAAERTGGASARDDLLSTARNARPCSARNFFAGTARRVDLSGAAPGRR